MTETAHAVLVVMDLQSRRIQIAGIFQEPYEDWMFQGKPAPGCRSSV